MRSDILFPPVHLAEGDPERSRRAEGDPERSRRAVEEGRYSCAPFTRLRRVHPPLTRLWRAGGPADWRIHPPAVGRARPLPLAPSEVEGFPSPFTFHLSPLTPPSPPPCTFCEQALTIPHPPHGGTLFTPHIPDSALACPWLPPGAIGILSHAGLYESPVRGGGKPPHSRPHPEGDSPGCGQTA